MIKKLSIMLFTMLAAVYAVAGDVTLKQSMDSAYILMGRTVTVNVELLKNGPLDGSLMVQDKAFPPEVEIASQGESDTSSMGNDRYMVRRRIVLQSFDSGVYTIPPVLYIRGNDTVASSPLALKVIPVPVDTLKDIHDYADVRDSGLRWYDNLPDWIVDGWMWILLALLIIAGGVMAYLRYWRRRPAAEVSVVRREPPYDEAVRRLTELREEHLCENGKEREFYTRITEILREYLYNRFGINAMEMTSSQILHALGSREDTRMTRSLMDHVLEMADFVKFAKARPLPDDNVKTFRFAMQFVEDTKPVPEPVETEQPVTKQS